MAFDEPAPKIMYIPRASRAVCYLGRGGENNLPQKSDPEIWFGSNQAGPEYLQEPNKLIQTPTLSPQRTGLKHRSFFSVFRACFVCLVGLAVPFFFAHISTHPQAVAHI